MTTPRDGPRPPRFPPATSAGKPWPQVCKEASALSLTGTVTLDGQGNPDVSVHLPGGSTLITASNSTVKLIGQAQPCNVFWQVGSSATLGTNTTFVGSILA